MATTAVGEHPLILVASQESDFTDCLRIFFEGSGYRVQTTDAAAPALDMARELRPDLIVLALMGDVTIEALGELRREPVTQETPVVVLLATAPDNPRVAPIHELAQAYIPMPLELENVLVHVARLLGRSEG